MTIATAEGILLAACRYSKLTPGEVRSKSRIKRFARTRQAICKALRERTAWSYPHIARYASVGDHSSARYAVEMAAVYAETDPWFAGLLDAVMAADPIAPMQEEDIARQVVALRAIAPAKPKPIRPVFKSVRYYSQKNMLIDDAGFEPSDLRYIRGMAAASRELACAVNALRGAA